MDPSATLDQNQYYREVMVQKPGTLQHKSPYLHIDNIIETQGSINNEEDETRSQPDFLARPSEYKNARRSDRSTHYN